MVSPFYLVLDEHPVVGRDVFTKNASTERSHFLFLRFQLQGYPDSLAEEQQVLLLSEPRSEAPASVANTSRRSTFVKRPRD